MQIIIDLEIRKWRENKSSIGIRMALETIMILYFPDIKCDYFINVLPCFLILHLSNLLC